MSVAIACTVPDGVILGVDSAVTIGDANNPQNNEVADKSEYQIVFNSMPIERGIEYVKFLVQLVISHHRFSTGAPIVGGTPRVGLVTYKSEDFKILGGDEYAG